VQVRQTWQGYKFPATRKAPKYVFRSAVTVNSKKILRTAPKTVLAAVQMDFAFTDADVIEEGTLAAVIGRRKIENGEPSFTVDKVNRNSFRTAPESVA
jgi:hypothetical protein